MFPSGPYGRDNSIRQTMYGVNAEATKRLGGAVTQLWTLGGEWYGNKTEQQSSGYDNCPVIRPGTPAPFGPRACDMLHTNQADVPQSKGSQWAMWVQDEFGFADGRYTLTPALRYDHYKQKPESTDSYASNPNAGKLPSANSAGRFSPKLLAGWKAADELSLYAQYAYGFKAPSPSQLYTNYGGAGTYLRVGNPDLKPETSKGWELGAKLGSDDLGGALSFFDNRYQNFIDTSVPLDAIRRCGSRPGRASIRWASPAPSIAPACASTAPRPARTGNSRPAGAPGARWPGPWARMKAPAST